MELYGRRPGNWELPKNVKLKSNIDQTCFQLRFLSHSSKSHISKCLDLNFQILSRQTQLTPEHTARVNFVGKMTPDKNKSLGVLMCTTIIDTS